MSATNKAAVIFDVGGVLITPPQLAIAEYEKEISLPRGLIGTALTVGAPDNGFCRMERGEITLSQFVPVLEQELHTIARERGITFPHGFSALELFKRMTASYQLRREMMEAVWLIRDRGLKTCVVTNNWIDDVIRRHDVYGVLLQEAFDVVIESSRVGLRKPDPEIYRLACRQLDIEPHQAVFLDDLGVNLKSAKEVGISTIKVTDPVMALEELGSILGLTFSQASSKL